MNNGVNVGEVFLTKTLYRRKMPINRVIGLPQLGKKMYRRAGPVTCTFIIAFNLESEFFLDITLNDFVNSV